MHRNLTLVGDPQQCIYSWRQAERANLQRLAQRWPEASVTRLCLTQSYRSTQRVLRCGTTILRSRLLLGGQPIAADPHAAHVPDLHSHNGDGVPVSMHVYDDAAAEAAGIAHHLALLFRGGGEAAAAASSSSPWAASDAAQLGALAGLVTSPLTGSGSARRRPLVPSDVAILARTAKQLQTIAEALKRRGIRCSQGEGAKLCDHPAVKEVLAHLRLLLDGADSAAFELVAKGARASSAARLRAPTF